MKSSTKILIGVIIALSFFIGFYIGITANSQKIDNEDLVGTIGKISSFKKVKKTENNINLLSDLRTNESLLKSYQQYFKFHYSSCIKLSEDIDFAIQTSEIIPEFRENYTVIIQDIKQYRLAIEQANKDILLVNTSLQQLSQSNEKDFLQTIKNAHNAVSEIKDKQNCLPAFVNAIEKFMSGNNPYKFSNLIKVHDMFAVNQLVVSP